MTEAYSFDTGYVAMRSRVGLTTLGLLPKWQVASRFSDPVDRQTFRISQENKRRKKARDLNTRQSCPGERRNIRSQTDPSRCR